MPAPSDVSNVPPTLMPEPMPRSNEPGEPKPSEANPLEKSPGLLRFPRAAGNAVSFARQAGVSLPQLARTGLQMRKDQELTWSQVALAANAPMMTKASVVDGDAEVGILPTGQVVGAIEDLPPVADLLARIMDEADATLSRLSP